MTPAQPHPSLHRLARKARNRLWWGEATRWITGALWAATGLLLLLDLVHLGLRSLPPLPALAFALLPVPLAAAALLWRCPPWPLAAGTADRWLEADALFLSAWSLGARPAPATAMEDLVLRRAVEQVPVWQARLREAGNPTRRGTLALAAACTLGAALPLLLPGPQAPPSAREPALATDEPPSLLQALSPGTPAPTHRSGPASPPTPVSEGGPQQPSPGPTAGRRQPPPDGTAQTAGTHPAGVPARPSQTPATAVAPAGSRSAGSGRDRAGDEAPAPVAGPADTAAAPSRIIPFELQREEAGNPPIAGAVPGGRLEQPHAILSGTADAGVPAARAPAWGRRAVPLPALRPYLAAYGEHLRSGSAP